MFAVLKEGVLVDLNSLVGKVVEELHKVPWKELASNGLVLASTFSIAFAAFVIFFSPDLFVFVSAYSFASFMFQIGIVYALSAGSVRLISFFLEHYIINFVSAIFSAVCSAAAGVSATAFQVTRAGIFKRVALGYVELESRSSIAFGGVKRFSAGAVFSYSARVILFLVLFVQENALLGVLIFLAIFIVGYFLFCLGVAFETSGQILSVDLGEDANSSVPFRQVVKVMIESALDAQRRVTNQVTLSLFLGVGIEQFFGAFLSKESIRGYVSGYGALVVVCFAVPLGALRGHFVDTNSVFELHTNQAATDQQRDRLENVSVVIASLGNSLLLKEKISGQLVVIPLDSVYFLRKVETESYFWDRDFLFFLGR